MALILVVDEDENTRRVIRTLLGHVGHGEVERGGGRKACGRWESRSRTS